MIRGLALSLCLLAAAPAAAQEAVDLELVLLADATGSIDEAEIRFQRQGYVEAIQSAEVLGAIANGFLGKIAVTYVEWASALQQDVVVPWTVIEDAASAKAFADQLVVAPRRVRGSNAIGSAIRAGQELIERNDFDGFRKVIDLSADSSWNGQGIPLPVARADAVAADIVINGLAILCRAAECSGRPRFENLETEFSQKIIAGPGAFVVTAEDPESFADAVRRKLFLEIAGLTPNGFARAETVTDGASAP